MHGYIQDLYKLVYIQVHNYGFTLNGLNLGKVIKRSPILENYKTGDVAKSPCRQLSSG